MLFRSLRSLSTRLGQFPRAKNALRQFASGENLTRAEAFELLDIGVLQERSGRLVYGSGAYKAFFERIDWKTVV